MVLAIVGQHKFYVALSDFLGLIGFWTGDLHKFDPAGAWNNRLTTRIFPGAFVAALCMEHLYFRKGDFQRYDLRYWNEPSQLPLGTAAVGASLLSLFVVIPSMNQAWYTGPIARKAGDLGLEAALIITAVLYIPLRYVEKRWRGI
jgi:purine-cytosine permease-like protein